MNTNYDKPEDLMTPGKLAKGLATMLGLAVMSILAAHGLVALCRDGFAGMNPVVQVFVLLAGGAMIAFGALCLWAFTFGVFVCLHQYVTEGKVGD